MQLGLSLIHIYHYARPTPQLYFQRFHRGINRDHVAGQQHKILVPARKRDRLRVNDMSCVKELLPRMTMFICPPGIPSPELTLTPAIRPPNVSPKEAVGVLSLSLIHIFAVCTWHIF